MTKYLNTLKLVAVLLATTLLSSVSLAAGGGPAAIQDVLGNGVVQTAISFGLGFFALLKTFEFFQNLDKTDSIVRSLIILGVLWYLTFNWTTALGWFNIQV